MSATVNNSPIQDYTYPDDHIPPYWVPHNWLHHLNHLERPKSVLAFFCFCFFFAIVTGKRIHLFNTLVETYNVDQYYEKNFILEFQ